MTSARRALLIVLMGAIVFSGDARTAMASPHAHPTCDYGSVFAGYDAVFLLDEIGGAEDPRGSAAPRRVASFGTERAGERMPPCSTFKIPNALIGLETGVVADEKAFFKWHGVKRMAPEWNRDQTLASAFAVSAVWCFQEIAQRIGAERMKRWVDAFDYGNRDTSGGLTTFWLGSTLRISPLEQTEFLRRLVLGRLPVSERSMRIVRRMMVLSRERGVTFAGKTGSDWDPVRKRTILGWFVGYVIADRHPYVFATQIRGGESPAGRKARALTERILRDLGVLPIEDRRSSR